jgi:hypothetical protein
MKKAAGVGKPAAAEDQKETSTMPNVSLKRGHGHPASLTDEEVLAQLRLVTNPQPTREQEARILDEIVYGDVDLNPCRVSVYEVIATGRRVWLLTKFPKLPSPALLRRALEHHAAELPTTGAA